MKAMKGFKKGYTLIELLITVSVISIIIGMGISGYTNNLKEQRIFLTKKHLVKLKDDTFNYFNEHKTFEGFDVGQDKADSIFAGSKFYKKAFCIEAKLSEDKIYRFNSLEDSQFKEDKNCSSLKEGDGNSTYVVQKKKKDSTFIGVN